MCRGDIGRIKSVRKMNMIEFLDGFDMVCESVSNMKALATLKF